MEDLHPTSADRSLDDSAAGAAQLDVLRPGPLAAAAHPDADRAGADLTVLLAHALDGRCGNCLRVRATDADWENVPEGERPDLCWDTTETCPWVPPIDKTEFLGLTIAESPWLIKALAVAWERGRNSIAEDFTRPPDPSTGMRPATKNPYQETLDQTTAVTQAAASAVEQGSGDGDA